ncbi:type II secretion system F family protein [Candidatus Woesearchaeota archaeon]|nr:type II secretion system F family protein [Candidatus Woesearchaeota archaeon]
MAFDKKLEKDIKKIEKDREVEINEDIWRVSLKQAGFKKPVKYYKYSILFSSVVVYLFVCLIALTYIEYSIWLFIGLIIGFFLMKELMMFGFMSVIEYNKYNRRKEIELFLPLFLQITSSNLAAGMNIEEALLFSSRKRFGLLSKEMGNTSKKAMSGQSLKSALEDLTDKYDSKILRRSIALISESMRTGSKLSPVLDKIAQDISERNIIRKEINSNVSTYIIFITFAAVLAAPVLYSLGGELINVMIQMFSTLKIPENSIINPDIESFNSNIFFIFSIINISITSIISALIVNSIVKGNIKEDIYKVPLFLIVGLSVFFICNIIISRFFSMIYF